MRPWSVLSFVLISTSVGRVAWADDNQWPMFNHDPQGTRSSSGETVLSRATVGGLHVKWSFATPGPVTGTPVVVGNGVYFGDGAGYFYAVDRAGHLKWRVNVGVTVTASGIVVGDRVIFGDLAGFIWGINA